MHTSRPLAAIAIALLSAALLTGCGGMSKAEYEKEIEKVATQVDAEQKKLSEGAPSPESLATLSTTLDKAADDIEDVDAPSEIAATHDALVKWLRASAKLADQAVPLMEAAAKDPTKLGEKELAELNELSEKFAKSEKDLAKIEKGYEDKDYDLGFQS